MDIERVILTTAIIDIDAFTELSQYPTNIFKNDQNKKLYDVIKNQYSIADNISFAHLSSLPEIVNDASLSNMIFDMANDYEIEDDYKFIIGNMVKNYRDNLNREAASQLLEGSIDIDEMLEKIEYNSKIVGKSEKKYTDFKDFDMCELEKRAKNRKLFKTNINELDRKIGGFYQKQLITIAAAPGMGKTTIALQIASYYNALFYAWEMGSEELYYKHLSRKSSVDSRKIEHMKMDNYEIEKVIKANSDDSKYTNLRCYDEIDTFSEMMSTAQRDIKNEGFEIMFLDYLQIVDGVKGKSENEILTKITKTLKRFARKNNVPVVAMSQFTKDTLKDGVTPTIGHLRGSGAIAQDSDVVILIYEVDGKVVIEIAKNRKGPIGIVKYVDFENEFSRFVDC